MTAFEEFGVLPEIAKAVDEMGWTLPTDVQSEAIPLILGGGDVLMAAETGSGKTGAFCLPILQITLETIRDIADEKRKQHFNSVFPESKRWTMSFIDREVYLAISPNGLICQSREFQDWHGCRCTTGVKNSGKYFYEAKVTDEGLCRVGWSTSKAKLDLGTDRFGYGFGGTGKKSNNRQFDDYGEPYGINDIIGCCLDLDLFEITFFKNGVNLGIAFKIETNLHGESFFPAVVLKNAEMCFNFGRNEFAYSIPCMFIPISHVGLDNMSINPQASSSASHCDLLNKPNAPQAIIIEPSRELAEQTYNQIIKFKKFVKDPNIKHLLLVGGTSVKDQLSLLHAGVHILVATPGRLEDLIGAGHLLLGNCRFFVLDEVDGLLKQGHSDLIDRIHKKIPKITSDGCRLQMVACSATLHSFEVKKMAERLMHFPTWVDLKGEDAVPETVHHCVCMIDPQRDLSWKGAYRQIQTDGVHSRDNLNLDIENADTLSEAVKILKGEYCIKAINKHKMDRAIIFCRTKLDCDNLEQHFKKYDNNQYSCVCLHGDRKPSERKMNLEIFQKLGCKYLICTDVAARGLDITGLPYMINMTLPDEKSNYVHRIGRVGRRDRMGLAISIVSTVPEKVWYHGEWCSSRGRNCSNTQLTNNKGCCIWYNEKNILSDIEEHLNISIPQIGSDLQVPINEFDGKVVYGKKLETSFTTYKNHVMQLLPTVRKLSDLEIKSQTLFLKRLKL